MKIYLSSSYQRLEEMREHRNALELNGHEVCSRWLGGEMGKNSANAVMDVEDVLHCEGIITFTEAGDAPRSMTSGGRHVEFGMAIATGKVLMVVGLKENVFHHLPAVMVFDTLEELIERFLKRI